MGVWLQIHQDLVHLTLDDIDEGELKEYFIEFDELLMTVDLVVDVCMKMNQVVE